jgi:hypothetical protein
MQSERRETEQVLQMLFRSLGVSRFQLVQCGGDDSAKRAVVLIEKNRRRPPRPRLGQGRMRFGRQRIGLGRLKPMAPIHRAASGGDERSPNRRGRRLPAVAVDLDAVRTRAADDNLLARRSGARLRAIGGPSSKQNAARRRLAHTRPRSGAEEPLHGCRPIIAGDRNRSDRGPPRRRQPAHQRLRC